MFKNSYNSETNIITTTAFGIIDAEKLEDLKVELDAGFHALEEVNILLDYRNAQLNFP